MSEHKHLKRSRNRIQKTRPRFVRRWHRRLGLLSALAVILLSVTGLLLNHVSQVFSSNSYVSADWVLDWYDIEAPNDVQSFQNLGSPSFIWADGTVLVNQRPILFNQSELLGVHQYQDIFHLLTATDLHLFTGSGEFIESVKLADVPEIESAYVLDMSSKVVLDGQGQALVLDLDDLSVIARSNVVNNGRVDGLSLAAQLNRHSSQDAEVALVRKNILLKSKVLVDIHSGRFIGSWGVWLMDFFAICFLLLAASGILAWRRSLARS